MTGSGLQEYGGESPIWGFVRQLAAERWTGQAEVGIDPRVELYSTEGTVYFAQKVDDAPLGARLVAVGALTAAQLRGGSVQLGTTISLARLFQRQPDVDRDTVELTVDRFTEQLLEQVAEHPVGDVSLHPLRHHPSGIHQWRRHVAPAPVETDEATVSALVDAVVSLSGQVPVVHADAGRLDASPAPAAAPVAAPTPEATPTADEEAAPALHLADPTVAPMTFDPVVPLVPGPEPTLPTLSSLPGLTPLPTLGAPASSPARPAAAASSLPSLGHPTMDPPPILHVAPAPVLAPPPAPVAPVAPAQVAEHVADPVADLPPEPPQPDPEPGLGTRSPAEPPVTAMTAAPEGAKMVAPNPGTNAAGAPAEVEAEAEEIWGMVDELLGLPHPAAPATAPAASDKKSRGWLRGRKG